MQILTMFLPLFKNLTACAEDLRDNLRGASPPSEPSGENRLLLLLEPDSATSELRLLESDNSDLSSSLFLLACQKESVITSTVVCRITVQQVRHACRASHATSLTYTKLKRTKQQNPRDVNMKSFNLY